MRQIDKVIDGGINKRSGGRFDERDGRRLGEHNGRQPNKHGGGRHNRHSTRGDKYGSERVDQGARSVVGRAELKLAEAATAFHYDFRGKTVLDIGSSTGGFTEYALGRGAKKVIAVEKGTRQMKAPLRFDSRVELHEKTDFLEIDRNCARGSCQGTESGDRLAVPLQVDTVLADVSFVSLRVILARAKQIIGREADYLVMLKPQFEAKNADLVKGVIKNEKIRREIIRNFEQWLHENGFLIIKKRDNELVGRNGNRERFYYLKLARTKSVNSSCFLNFLSL